MSTTKTDPTNTAADPIDLLVPAPRPWWVRMTVGVATAAAVGTLAFLWGFGYIVPRPECCGTSSASAFMSFAPGDEAVTITAAFFNSSGRDLTIRAATAELPGADVIDIALLDPDNDVFPTDNVSAFPGRAPATDVRTLLITFVPTTCQDTTEDWGSVTVDLAVAGSGLPSFPRRYHLPDPIVSTGGNDLAVLPPEALDDVAVPQTPLAAACLLLGR